MQLMPAKKSFLKNGGAWPRFNSISSVIPCRTMGHWRMYGMPGNCVGAVLRHVASLNSLNTAQVPPYCRRTSSRPRI